MKYSCGIIKDLMPLYCDGVCSEESSEAVEAHLKECEDCKQMYEKLITPDEISDMVAGDDFVNREIVAVKKIKKKWSRKKKILIGGGVAIGVGLVYACRKILILISALGVLLLGYKSASVEVYTDIANYQGYIKNNDFEKTVGTTETVRDKKFEKFRHHGMRMLVFPNDITGDMCVEEFQVAYYNPWDDQYVSYLTVKYSEEDYEKELERLTEIGVADYQYQNVQRGFSMNYYGVTGEPDGYHLAAMSADPYYGFIYALTPKKEDRTITYVEILFCNYFLDLDIHEYLPEQYLLDGFDATNGNLYQKARTS